MQMHFSLAVKGIGLLLTINICIVTANVSLESNPPGHLEPIGSDRAPETNIDAVEGFSGTDPWTFHHRYSQPSKPLLFRAAAGIMPAFHRWTDQYMRDTYGDLHIQAEKGKKETRKDGVINVTLSEFLSRYKRDDIYMVQDVLEPMRADLVVPKPIVCGGNAEMMETVVVWFSSGGTTSVLHADGTDNINCLLDGTKHIYLVHKEYGEQIVSQGWNHDRGYSEVDVEKVDMYKFPNLRNIPWYSVNLKKQDCLFIPQGWFHTVATHPSRSIAVNLWFGPAQTFNQSDCDQYGKNIPEYDSLANEKYIFKGEGGAIYPEESDMDNQRQTSPGSLKTDRQEL